MTTTAPNAAAIVAHIKAGGRFLVKSYTKPIIVDGRALAKWDAAGQWLFKDDGNGVRMRQGRGSVFMLPMHFALIQ